MSKIFNYFLSFIINFFGSIRDFFKMIFFIVKDLEFKSMLLLSIFLFGVLGIVFSFVYLVVKKNSIRKYGSRPDSWLKEKVKIFLGFSKEKDCVEKYFESANYMLKSFLSTSKHYKYELPWYLTFGLSNAGKTSFLNSVELEQPLEMDNNVENYLRHYFFNDGVIIDVKSELIFNDPLHDFSWEKLLLNLKKTRENKSIDGIIYFVSLRELLSDNADDCSRIRRETEFLYFKLWQMQNFFYMKIPVYVVFTNLDCIVGFDKFLEKIESSKDDMFGWSNPYPLENRFSVDWVTEMFFSMEESLKFIQSEMMLAFPSEVGFNMMNFMNNFREIQNKIRDFLQATFQYNKYAAGLYFRGAYFTSLDKGKSKNIESVPFLCDNEVKYTQPSLEVSGKLYFGKDLLTQKIFLEKNIGRNETNKRILEYYIKRYKIFISSFSIFAVGYIYNLQNELVYVQDSLMPKILKIVEVLKSYENDSNYIHKKEFLDELKIVLIYLDDISKYNLSYYGVPTSWFSSLNRNKNKLFFKAYNELVLNVVFSDIERRYCDLANKRFLVSANDNATLIDPILMQEFLNLKELVDECYLLESYENKFDMVFCYHSVDNLKFLLKELFEINISKDFARNVVHSNVGLENKELKQKIYKYKNDISKKFNWCVSKFNNKCFTTKRIDLYFENLRKLLLLVDNESNDMSYDNMKSIQKDISELITFSSDDKFLWLKTKKFNSSDFDEVLNKIVQSQVLGGVDNAEKIYTLISTSYNDFKLKADMYKLPVIGRPFYLQNKSLNINFSVLNIHGVLNDIFSESFMNYSYSFNLEKMQVDEHIKWDSKILEEISDTIKNYLEFSKKRPNNKFEKIIKNIANNNIKKLVYFKLSKARKIVVLKNDKAMLNSLSENIKITNQSMNDIMKFFKETDSEAFHRLTTIQKFNLIFYLKCVNNAFENDRLYQIQGDSLGADPVNKKLYYKINLQDYLESQRIQLNFYVERLALDAIKGLDDVRFLSDEKKELTLIYKFKSLAKDLDSYKLNPANSKLFQLESFFKKIESESLSIIVSDLKKKGNQEIVDYRFLENKQIIFKQVVKKFLDDSIKIFIDQQYEAGHYFYEEYALVFPFNLTGQLIGLKGYEEMVSITNAQKAILDFVKIIDPYYQARTFEFVDNLAKSHKLVKYIRSDDDYIGLKFKPYQKIGEMYEKNLKYLLNFSAKVNGQKPVAIYWVGDLKVYDSITFEVEIAKGYGVRFINLEKDGYKLVNPNCLTVSLDRQSFVRFLLENIKIINGQSFIRFTIPIEDDKGIKDDLVIMMPVELTLDGLKFDMPQKTFDKLIGDKL